VADADVERYLLQLTLLTVADAREVVAEHHRAPERRVAQHHLADELTTLVHGPEAVRQANLAAGVLFGGEAPTAERLGALRGIVPETVTAAAALAGDEALVDLLVATELASSRSDARRQVQQGAVSVNGARRGELTLAPQLLIDGRFLLLERGSKRRHLVVVEPPVG
jgi:tyrosyl-tRNA synthetase